MWGFLGVKGYLIYVIRRMEGGWLPMTTLWNFIIRDMYCHHFKEEKAISFLGKSFSEPGLKSRTSEHSPELCKYWQSQWRDGQSTFIPVSQHFLSHQDFFFVGGRWLLLLLLSCFSHVWLCATPWRQPTRLSHPWDPPGKNTGVGCHFLLQCMKVKSESEVAQSCLTLSNPMECSPPGSSVHGIF